LNYWFLFYFQLRHLLGNEIEPASKKKFKIASKEKGASTSAKLPLENVKIQKKGNQIPESKKDPISKISVPSKIKTNIRTGIVETNQNGQIPGKGFENKFKNISAYSANPGFLPKQLNNTGDKKMENPVYGMGEVINIDSDASNDLVQTEIPIQEKQDRPVTNSSVISKFPIMLLANSETNRGEKNSTEIHDLKKVVPIGPVLKSKHGTETETESFESSQSQQILVDKLIVEPGNDIFPDPENSENSLNNVESASKTMTSRNLSIGLSSRVSKMSVPSKVETEVHTETSGQSQNHPVQVGQFGIKSGNNLSSIINNLTASFNNLVATDKKPTGKKPSGEIGSLFRMVPLQNLGCLQNLKLRSKRTF
jgi:hypothetical protein